MPLVEGPDAANSEAPADLGGKPEVVREHGSFPKQKKLSRRGNHVGREFLNRKLAPGEHFAAHVLLDQPSQESSDMTHSPAWSGTMPWIGVKVCDIQVKIFRCWTAHGSRLGPTPQLEKNPAQRERHAIRECCKNRFGEQAQPIESAKTLEAPAAPREGGFSAMMQ